MYQEIEVQMSGNFGDEVRLRDRDVDHEDAGCDVIFVFRKYPESWKKVVIEPQHQNEIRTEIFLKKKLRSSLIGSKIEDNAPMSKFDFYTQMKTQFQKILTDTCHLIVQVQQDEGIDYLKIKASEEVLRNEAHEQGYKLRLKLERDPNEFASECPPYAPFDNNYFDEELFSKQTDGTLWRQIDRIRLIQGEIEDYIGIPQASKIGLCEYFVPHDPNFQYQLHKY